MEEPHDDSIYINRAIPHIKQLSDFDCGHSCLKMVLTYACGSSANCLSDLDDLLAQMGLNKKSLWTIDLAHVCALKRVRHAMYTITMGASASFAGLSFYSSEQKRFDAEKLLVDAKFRDAVNLGICVLQRSVSVEFIRAQLQTHQAACVLLVDANLLNGKWVESSNECISYIGDSDDANSAETSGGRGASSRRANEQHDNNYVSAHLWTMLLSCCSLGTWPSSMRSAQSGVRSDVSNSTTPANCPAERTYCGHFIVLIGFDDSREIFFYRNPASIRRLSYTTYADLENARKAHGTDQDILFVYKEA